MRIYEASIAYKLVSLGEDETPLDSPSKVVEYMRGAFDIDPMKESFWVIALDRKNKPIGRHMVSLGTVSGSLVHPREVFKPILMASASAFICVHNHPSGDPAPSSADIKVTRSLKQAAQLLDIDLLDHVIIGDFDRFGGSYSFADNGLI